MGDKEVIMEQSIGVICEIPTKKVICVRKKPVNAAAKMYKKSFNATFSRGIKSDVIQNNIPAPSERKQKRAIGETTALPIMSFVTIILSPKITYATKQARCPFKLPFSILIMRNTYFTRFRKTMQNY